MRDYHILPQSDFSASAECSDTDRAIAMVKKHSKWFISQVSHMTKLASKDLGNGQLTFPTRTSTSLATADMARSEACVSGDI